MNDSQTQIDGQSVVRLHGHDFWSEQKQTQERAEIKQ